MLNLFFINFNFHSFCQSGCYIDFFCKKLSEIFVSNFFMYSAQFVGEKYMMEFLTKNIFNQSMFLLNKILGVNNLKYFDFFYNMLLNFFYIMIFLLFMYFFM